MNYRFEDYEKLLYTTVLGLALACTGCSDFLEDQVPQGTIDNEQLQNPEYVDNLVISAYAVWISAGEDINSSFSMWNFDVRSDDAYKGETEQKMVMCFTN